MKETNEEQKATEERVFQDRQYQVQYKLRANGSAKTSSLEPGVLPVPGIVQ